MKKRFKKLGALLVVMVLMLAMSVSAFAANDPTGTNVPSNVALHILNISDPNACLNALTSGVPVSGTYITTYPDKTAYEGTHAFRLVTGSDGYSYLCSDIMVNGTYANAGYWESSNRFKFTYTRNSLDHMGCTPEGNSVFSFFFPTWGKKMNMSSAGTGYGLHSFYVDGTYYVYNPARWTVLRF